MIKGRINFPAGPPGLLIGLSRENTRRLHQGTPIAFDTGVIEGLPSMKVIIFAGETEAAMAEELSKYGAEEW